MDGYTRTMFTLTTAPKLKALCWLCLPDGVHRNDPQPALVATPGHGFGAKDLLAMNIRRKRRREGEGYQKDLALQAVRLGYPVLVVEPLGFGERREKEMLHLPTAGNNGCHQAALMATLLGTTLPGIRIHELRRCIDYLQTVPEVDGDRIGMMGISGGGGHCRLRASRALARHGGAGGTEPVLLRGAYLAVDAGADPGQAGLPG
jgi:hypothetical protein